MCIVLNWMSLNLKEYPIENVIEYTCYVLDKRKKRMRMEMQKSMYGKEETEEKLLRKRSRNVPQDVRAAKYETGLRDTDEDLDDPPLLVSFSIFILQF